MIMTDFNVWECRDTDDIHYHRLSEYSLSKACYSLLGRPLLKEEQISDWDSVSLSSNQISYAALDAHCLLGLLHIVITGLRSALEGIDNTRREELDRWTDIGVDGMYVQADFLDNSDSLDEDRGVDHVENIEEEREVEGLGSLKDDATASLCVNSDRAEGTGTVASSSDRKDTIRKKRRPQAYGANHFAMSSWLNDSFSLSVP